MKTAALAPSRACVTSYAAQGFGAILVAGGLCLERWGRCTSATRSERRDPLPGDEAVKNPEWQLTRAITVARPPAEVWPWLVQMGYPKSRAG